MDGLVLADPEHPVGALIFNRRIPPARQMNHMVRSGERQADSTGAGRQDHCIESVALLECCDARLACPAGNRAVDDKYVLGTAGTCAGVPPPGRPASPSSSTKISAFSCRAAMSSRMRKVSESRADSSIYVSRPALWAGGTGCNEMFRSRCNVCRMPRPAAAVQQHLSHMPQPVAVGISHLPSVHLLFREFGKVVLLQPPQHQRRAATGLRVGQFLV